MSYGDVQKGNPECRRIEIVALRNRLVHGYFAVDHDILWTIATDDVPRLIAALEAPPEDA